MTLTLKRNKPFGQSLSVLFDRGIVPGYSATANLRLTVFNDSLTVDNVRDLLIAQHDRFCNDPLVTIERIRRRVDAVPSLELSAINNVRAGRTHIPRRTSHPIAEAAKELKLNRDWKVLSGRHRLGILRVEHRTAVANGPLRSSGCLVSNESVFHAQAIMRERLFVKQMTELIVKRLVLVVPHLDQSVIDAEGVAKVLTRLMPLDLDDPVVEILAIKKRDPLFAISVVLSDGNGSP